MLMMNMIMNTKTRKKFKFKKTFWLQTNAETVNNILTNDAHWVVINMNDTFYYACADLSEINAEDFVQLLPYRKKYGFDAFIAYEAIKRGHDPKIDQNNTKNMQKVKKILLDKMEKDEEFLFDLNYEIRKQKKETEEFGSKLIYKRYDKIVDGENCYRIKCFPEANEELYGVGFSVSLAIQDLRNKIRKQNNFKQFAEEVGPPPVSLLAIPAKTTNKYNLLKKITKIFTKKEK